MSGNGTTLHPLLVPFRQAEWLNATRARAYLVILATVSGLVALVYLALSRDGLDPTGKPLGTDFASFWTASQLALSGNPATAWNMQLHKAAQAALFGEAAGYAAFFYPPPYLLVCAPLAVLPYTLSLLAWLAATGTAWLSMMRTWTRTLGEDRIGWLTLMAFPAVLVNAGHGQNGFLTAALLGFGALHHKARPCLAGAAFGALVIKPQLGLLIPLFLVFTRNGRAFAAAGLAAGALCAVASLFFGLESWKAFFAASEMARAVLADNLVGYEKMQSVYAALRGLGMPASVAWCAQAIMLTLAVASLWYLRSAQPAAAGAAFACATLLATPFVLDYDLTLLAVPLVWLFAQGMRTGFMPWEKLVLALGYILPLVSRPLAGNLHLPLASLVIAALLAAILRRHAANAVPPEVGQA